jgi:hypothetical protein
MGTSVGRFLALVVALLALAECAPAADTPRDAKNGPTSAEIDAAVARGLAWLVKAQAEDGHWSLNRPDYDVAATALGLLPLLCAGETHRGQLGLHGASVERGLRYLLQKQGADGGFGMGYYHALATMALCETYLRTSDPRLKAPAQRAINYIVDAQGPNGGWRYTPKMNGDTSITCWMMQALKLGEQAGLRVPKTVWTDAAKFLDTVAGKKGGYGYIRPENFTPRTTASGCLCRLLLDTPITDEHFQKSVAILRKAPPTRDEQNIYYYYHASSVMNRLDAATRDPWNRAMWALLVEKQERGQQDGSWPEAGDALASLAGRVMTTSLALLTLELHYPPYRKPLPLAPRELKVSEVETCWKELAGATVLQATEHVRLLTAGPKQTVPYLRERLHPVPEVDAKVLARLIAELGHERFPVRQKAEDELEKLGERAVPALEKMAASGPPLDLQRRVQRLLDRVARQTITPDYLRFIRALHVLEAIASPEAREILKALAAGAPRARETQAAAEALKRLTQDGK